MIMWTSTSHIYIVNDHASYPEDMSKSASSRTTQENLKNGRKRDEGNDKIVKTSEDIAKGWSPLQMHVIIRGIYQIESLSNSHIEQTSNDEHQNWKKDINISKNKTTMGANKHKLYNRKWDYWPHMK